MDKCLAACIFWKTLVRFLYFGQLVRNTQKSRLFVVEWCSFHLFGAIHWMNFPLSLEPLISLAPHCGDRCLSQTSTVDWTLPSVRLVYLVDFIAPYELLTRSKGKRLCENNSWPAKMAFAILPVYVGSFQCMGVRSNRSEFRCGKRQFNCTFASRCYWCWCVVLKLFHLNRFCAFCHTREPIVYYSLILCNNNKHILHFYESHDVV